MSSDGKMKRTIGKSSFTAIFSADSSARVLWIWRSDSAKICNASAMLLPKRSA